MNRGPSQEPSRLVGRWGGRVGPEAVGIEFLPDGRLAYVIESEGKEQRMVLTWRVDGEDLVTNQPSAPREERTRIRWDRGGLVLEFDGVLTRFTRLTVE
jgi:hypothetical protein